ncbi:hypothetical protein NCCP2716_10440 [Sporosarcina sp. NCCP-2716]|uniref:hypothetical protein n=1 Tax=Sporosarcina sp. NCCP-2716 TaxID=2943679 RepID=UPI00204064CA|nr:hypothetical protein [Sporosarcina sp. NCCP-2716]GKV68546.1 hypothetical protein NCCP2716_10440 [Sporosarcina sp. NCCP-2716]
MSFKRIRKLDKQTVEVETEFIDKYIEYINENSIKEVQINSSYYFDDTLSFLTKCPQITHVYIVDSVIKDYSALYSLTELKCLSSQSPIINLDFSLLCDLEELSIIWNKSIKNLDSCKKIKYLNVSKFNPANGNLTSLSISLKIETLILNQTSVTSLQGIEKLSKLKILHINYAKKLKNFIGIEALATSLEQLDLYACRGVESYKALGEASSLKKLIIDKCNAIGKLFFLDELKNLEWFVCMDTPFANEYLPEFDRMIYVYIENNKECIFKKDNR